LSRGKLVVLAAVAVLMVVIFCLAGASAASTEGPVGQEKVIRVFGEAEITASPDVARIVLGVETRSETAEEAVSENARLMDGVIEALKAMGLEEEQLETGHYRLHSYQERQRPEPTEGRDDYITAYRASNSITITLYDLEASGTVIDTAVKAGANQVQSVSFDLKDAESFKLQALKKATAQARRKAEAVAAGAGVSIKEVKSITEDAAGYTPYRVRTDDIAAMEADHPTPILPGDVQVRARVGAEYSF